MWVLFNDVLLLNFTAADIIVICRLETCIVCLGRHSNVLSSARLRYVRSACLRFTVIGFPTQVPAVAIKTVFPLKAIFSPVLTFLVWFTLFYSVLFRFVMLLITEDYIFLVFQSVPSAEATWKDVTAGTHSKENVLEKCVVDDLLAVRSIFST